MQTDQPVRAIRPNRLIVDKQPKISQIIDVLVPADRREFLKEKENNKVPRHGSKILEIIEYHCEFHRHNCSGTGKDSNVLEKW